MKKLKKIIILLIFISSIVLKTNALTRYSWEESGLQELKEVVNCDDIKFKISEREIEGETTYIGSYDFFQYHILKNNLPPEVFFNIMKKNIDLLEGESKKIISERFNSYYNNKAHKKIITGFNVNNEIFPIEIIFFEKKDNYNNILKQRNKEKKEIIKIYHNEFSTNQRKMSLKRFADMIKRCSKNIRTEACKQKIVNNCVQEIKRMFKLYQLREWKIKKFNKREFKKLINETMFTIYADDHQNIILNEEEKDKTITINSETKIYSIGDIHGNINTLAEIFEILKENDVINYNLKINSNNHVVFQGDLADRGKEGIQVIQGIFLFKALNPEKVTILKGNHENFEYIKYEHINKGYIIKQIESTYKSTNPRVLIPTILLNCLKIVYSTLPEKLIVQQEQNPTENKLIICHGDHKSNWNDIHHDKIFTESFPGEDIDELPSNRGGNSKIKSSNKIISELSPLGFSALIKGHYHFTPKDINYETRIKRTDSRIPIKLIHPTNYNLMLTTKSVGTINIGTDNFPIFVNIAGTIIGASSSKPNINYYTTLLKATIDSSEESGWKITPLVYGSEMTPEEITTNYMERIN